MLLFAHGLVAQALPGYAPGRAPVLYAVAGVIGTSLLLVVHEIGQWITAAG
ncbi:hypothetical protein [Streptomyces sp. NPDC048191]|uniref:hypothetical protein n=1 Tax=Streptomyces sp. NPDC048191 TaxID=3155484 RepID=UPI0033E5C131